MDVDREMKLVKSLDGAEEKSVQFLMASGMNGSALEHSVPEQLFSTPENPAEGISAVKALQIANSQGIPIYTITQENIATVLPRLQLEADVINNIRNAVNAGKEVTVSKTNITFNGWSGCGYIILNPVTGAGAYMISGSISGAKIVMALKMLIINLYLMLSGRGFDEAGEALKILVEELSLSYWLNHYGCVIAKTAEDIHAVIASLVYLGYAIYAIVAKQGAQRIIGVIGYVTMVLGAMTYFYNLAEQCVEESKV